MMVSALISIGFLAKSVGEVALCRRCGNGIHREDAG
jgi:hypothetical protein